MSEDGQLLSQYVIERSEVAFAELTERHIHLVYSAALRLVNGDVFAAQDVAQRVFTELARQAESLAKHPVLVGWLYTTTRHIALRMNRSEQRRKAREQEANTMNELLHDEPPAADWTQLGPVIEDVMHELDEKDRDAVLLRFFQKRSLREVGAALDLNENAARMRIERALDKLRGKLASRGITTTAAMLATAVGANAVHAAPAGLAATVSATAVAGAAVQFTGAITTTTKVIAMTTLQKTIIAASLAVAVGTGVYAVRQGSQMREQVQTLEQQQGSAADQIRQLEQERNAATGQVAALREENARLRSGQSANELLKLRGEVGVLRQKAGTTQSNASSPRTGLEKMMSDPAMKEYIRQAQIGKFKEFYGDFFKEQNMTPEQTEKFLNVMCDIAGKSMEQLSSAAQGNGQQPAAEDINGSPLHELLGDGGMARFKQYSDEIPAKITVKLLQQKLEENPLNEQQSAQLLQIVKAEPTQLTQGITGAPDKAFLGSQAEIDSFLQQLNESNQRIVQQASSILAPDQLTALDGILTNAIASRRLQAAALIQKH
jgi:RNA polymerase sigma factor (sigma-70 family)